MPLEPNEQANKMKEMPGRKNKWKPNTEYDPFFPLISNKSIKNYWTLEDNNSTKKNKDFKNKLKSKETNSKELLLLKNKRENLN